MTGCAIPSGERLAWPTPQKEHYEVVIVGGGPAGTSCARALAKAGVTDVLIVEAGSYDGFRIGESIPPECRIALRCLDIDEAFLEHEHEPCYGSCSYWGNDKRGYNDFLLNPHGHGWHLDRRRFDERLAAQALAAGAQLLTESSLRASEPTHDCGGYILSIGRAKHIIARVRADFVVDASGRRSTFARQRGARQIHSDSLICIAASVAQRDACAPFSRLTHLEAAEHGWWYLASVPGNTVVITFATHAQTVRTMQLHRPENWSRMLASTAHTSGLARGLDLRNLRLQSYPAPSYCLDRLCDDQWLAIGDAASSYDPVTAQGIIKSLANGVLAAQTLLERMSGEANALDTFARVVRTQYDQYLRMRRQLYCLERRWPESGFWKTYGGI